MRRIPHQINKDNLFITSEEERIFGGKVEEVFLFYLLFEVTISLSQYPTAQEMELGERSVGEV